MTEPSGEHEHSRIEEELEHLVEVAEEGQSEATPLILGLGVMTFVSVVVVVVLAVALVAYYLAR
jgi:hypothetical protein